MVPLATAREDLSVFIGGYCIDDNGPDVTEKKAGCAFVYGRNSIELTPYRSFKFGLEQRGPSGEYQDPTDGRALLRAVVAVLESKQLYTEGWKRIIFASSNAQLAHGINQAIISPDSVDWGNKLAANIVSLDLWGRLLSLVGRLRSKNVSVHCIPISPQTIKWARWADRLARYAAEQSPRYTYYMPRDLNKPETV